MTAWKTYVPSDKLPWDLSRVVHLHRRCVFGASQQELQRDLGGDPQDAVSRILEGASRSESVPSEFEQVSELLRNAAVDSDNPLRLKAWWVYRMLYSPHPLQERMTLMWHCHFATSNLKVKNLAQMSQQNEVLRRRSLGSFANLLHDVMHDPALLRWLDAPSNRQGQANENLARELMELFTIGVGNYHEADVSEAARILTGWTVRRGKATLLSSNHDAGEKSVLGESGNFGLKDLLAILTKHTATSNRIAWRICSEFFGENLPGEAAINELAAGLRERDLDVGWACETVIRSERFFETENIGTRVCDPATFLIAPLRAMECWRWSPSTLILASWLARFGQDLFYPPNVGGWTGGRSWLATRTLLARANYVQAIALGQLTNPPEPFELPSVFEPDSKSHSSGNAALASILLGATNDKAFEQDSSDDANTEQGMSLQALANVLSSPRAHLH